MIPYTLGDILGVKTRVDEEVMVKEKVEEDQEKNKKGKEDE